MFTVRAIQTAWFDGANEFDLEGAGTVRGFLGGFQAGYNYQINWVVAGIEGDFSWSGVKGQFLCHDGNPCTANARWFSTLTGRLGGTFDHTLIYVKGGVAWVNDRFSFSDFAPVALGSKTRSGWTAGAGIEYAFTPNWSAKIEYDYMDFGTSRVSFTGGNAPLDPPDDQLIKQRIHMVKAGVNYKFDWGALR